MESEASEFRAIILLTAVKRHIRRLADAEPPARQIASKTTHVRGGPAVAVVPVTDAYAAMPLPGTMTTKGGTRRR